MKRKVKRTTEQNVIDSMAKLEAAKLAAKRRAEDAAFASQIPNHPW